MPGRDQCGTGAIRLGLVRPRSRERLQHKGLAQDALVGNASGYPGGSEVLLSGL